MAKARVEKYNGEPAIIIDGKVYPPMTATTITDNPEYLEKLGKSGIKIFYVISKMRWNNPGTGKNDDGVTETLGRIKNLLEVVPDAYIILRLNVNPSVQWINSHPEEQGSILFSHIW